MLTGENIFGLSLMMRSILFPLMWMGLFTSRVSLWMVRRVGVSLCQAEMFLLYFPTTLSSGHYSYLRELLTLLSFWF